MFVISIKKESEKESEWFYLSEIINDSDKIDIISCPRKYSWTGNIKYAKIFESLEEASIFWKVSKDKKLLSLFNGSDLGIRKILFKREKELELSSGD